MGFIYIFNVGQTKNRWLVHKTLPYFKETSEHYLIKINNPKTKQLDKLYIRKEYCLKAAIKTDNVLFMESK